MERWCLDSNIWIGLSRDPNGPAARELDRRVRSGAIEIVLPLTVYLEAVKTGRADWRANVTGEVRKYWKGRTLRPFARAWREELRAALAGSEPDVFGSGLEHLAGVPLEAVEPDLAELVRVAMNDPHQMLDMVLAGASPAFHDGLDEIEAMWVERMRDRDSERRTRGISGEAAVRRDIAQSFFDHYYLNALPRGEGRLRTVDDMLALPTLRVHVEMATRRAVDQGDPNPNDARDIMLLSVAVPYCDVVVTEKRWGHFIENRGRLDSQFDTKLWYGADPLHRALAAG